MRHSRSASLRAFLCTGSLAALATIFSLAAPAARAQVTVYSNNFEANANGFTPTNREVLTTDPTGGGATSSTFLGRFTNGTATLSLSGLTPGVVHTVEFDLYIGATMDGDEPISLTADGTTLLNSTFSNFFSQAYSDTEFLTTSPRDEQPFTGADVARTTAPSNFDRFSIYFFSRGAGNPVLTFTPTLATTTLTWTGSGMQEATDEFWALDNVSVIAASSPNVVAPEPGTLSLLALAGAIGIAGVIRRRRA